MTHTRCLIAFLTVLLFIPFLSHAQSLLEQRISVETRNEPLTAVLDKIAKAGGFYFSYNSNLAKGDSGVNLSIRNIPVKQALDQLFRGRMAYKEMSGYIILRASAPPPYWYISGTVRDDRSGEKLANVSIYESGNLTGTITDDKGYFRLSLKEKNKYPPVMAVHVSRVSYNDTSFIVNTGYDQELEVAIQPSDNALETVIVNSRIQRSGLPRLFISSRLKKQSANLRNFLASKPYQFSLTPGLGTHGELGAQVINNFSFNILGGYTAGVNGFELAGLFNITKKEVKKVQIAGLFNVVGGYVYGLQIAGVHNKVLDSVHGMQVAGITNRVKGDFTGLQLSGLVSDIEGNAEGLIVAGITGTVQKDVKGWQVSGITGINRGQLDGVQISGIYNRTSHLKGLQIGLINVADTAEGYSIGLLNINKKGYHRFSLSGTDQLDLNIAYKAGHKNLYVILQGGLNILKDKAYGLGYGFGNELTLHSRFSLINELTCQSYYTGNWNSLPFTTTLRSSLVVSRKNISFFAGPALSVGRFPEASAKGYAFIIPSHGLFRIDDHRGWIGWQAGISF